LTSHGARYPSIDDARGGGRSGALVGASKIINLKTTCGGSTPGGNCDDVWTLAPIFGALDAGACFGNGVDAGGD
jgi:hypothetical protein